MTQEKQKPIYNPNFDTSKVPVRPFQIGTQESDRKYETADKFYLTSDKADNGLPMKTDLTQEQVLDISTIEGQQRFILREWGIETNWKTDITVPLKEHQVSRKRGGRKEWVSISLNESNQESKEAGLLQRMMGKRS